LHYLGCVVYLALVNLDLFRANRWFILPLFPDFGKIQTSLFIQMVKNFSPNYLIAVATAMAILTKPISPPKINLNGV